jgi:hypothetical protein
MPMATKGSILPTSSTHAEMGVTSTCSRVPVEGVPVARLLFVDSELKTLAYHLPADEGDRVVSLVGPQWDRQTEQEVTNLVMAAKGLRRPSATTGSFDRGAWVWWWSPSSWRWPC